MGTARSIVMGITVALVLVATFVLGFFVRDLITVSSVNALVFQGGGGYELIDEVQSLLDDVYLREQPTYTVRQYGAVRGMLQTLEDPNTFFIDPPVARSEADVLAGTYGGIGVVLSRNELGQFVLYPFEDGPATEAGVLDGDILIAVNGETVDVSTQQDVVDQQLRGEVRDGNGVEITVDRADNDEPVTMFIVFDVINVPSVIWRELNDERLGYIQILRFTNRTPDEVREALADLTGIGTGIRALVLDLRNNSGGLLDESITVADIFLETGAITVERSKGRERIVAATAHEQDNDLPMVTLVNNRTASASEIVAGALQDQERSILVGQRTYGKGTVQQIFSLSDGSSVHITSAEWFTPEGRPIDGIGLEPDIAMIPAENGRDVEIGEAIRYLQSVLDSESGTQ